MTKLDQRVLAQAGLRQSAAAFPRIALTCATTRAAWDWQAATVGLDRPLIPAALVANWFRSARVSLPRRPAFGSARVSRPRRSTDRGSPGDAPSVGDWETVGRRGRAGQENPARTSLRGTWFKPRMAGGPTDARENLKKLRRQLGLRNN